MGKSKTLAQSVRAAAAREAERRLMSSSSAAVPVSLVKEVRLRTNAGMKQCKEALVQANGDLEVAVAILQGGSHMPSPGSGMGDASPALPGLFASMAVVGGADAAAPNGNASWASSPPAGMGVPADTMPPGSGS